MLLKYFGVILRGYLLLLMLLRTQRCAAVVTRDASSANVPSELFKTVEAPTEQPIVINTVPPSASQPQHTGAGISESTKSSVSSNSQSGFPTFGQRSNVMPSSAMQSGFRPVPNFIEDGYGSAPFPTSSKTFRTSGFGAQPFPMGPQTGGTQHFSSGGGGFPFNGGSSSGQYYYSSSSSSSNGGGPMGGGMVGPMGGPSMGRFQAGPPMGHFGPSGPSGFTGGFGGGSSDGNFYRVSSSQTTYDSDVGVPITKNFEYDSRTGGNFFRRK